MKNFSNDIFAQTRSVLNELRQRGFDYEDSIMSLLVFLFVIDTHKKNFENLEIILQNDGYDFFDNLEFRAYDPENKEYYNLILDYLCKLDEYRDIIINSNLIYHYSHLTKSDQITLIDILIEDLSKNSNYQFAHISNENLNKVYSNLITFKENPRILDPCIGSGKLLVDLYKNGNLNPESAIIDGIEINHSQALLAYINLTLNGFKDVTIYNEDALDYLLLMDSENLINEKYDVIVSDLPIGIKITDKKNLAPNIPSNLRFYYLLIQLCRKAINNTGRIYISANSGLVKGLRRLTEKNVEPSIISELIEIKDVANWSYTSFKPYILSIEKIAASKNSEIKLIKLSTEDKNNHKSYIDRKEFDYFSHVENLDYFFSEAFERIYHEGRESFITLSKFFNNRKKNRWTLEKKPEIKNFILPREFIQDSSGFRRITISDLEVTNHQILRSGYLAKKGDWVLANQNGEMKVFISEVAQVALPINCVVLEPIHHLSKLTQDWLIAQFRSDFLQSQLLAYNSDINSNLFNPYLKLNKLFIDQHTTKEKERFVDEWKEGRIELLEREKKKVESKFADVKERSIEEQIDLIHDLHHSLKNELSIISGAAKSIKNYLERKSTTSESVSLDDPSREPRKGADPNLEKSIGDRLNTLLNSSEEMSIYLNDYKTILKFDRNRQNLEWIHLKEYFESIFPEISRFNAKIVENTDPLEAVDNDDYHLNCDRNVLRLVITNVITNAQKHGFIDDAIQYSFHVEIKEAPIDEVKWNDTYPHVKVPDRSLRITISNDGQPLSSNIDQLKFFKKGYYHGNNSGSGRGTYHIKKGIESMGGIVTLITPHEEELYNFQLAFYFPYPIYKSKNELKFNGDQQ